MNSLGKTLLVCSGACEDVRECLAGAGCGVVKVSDGEGAVSQARRELFDAVVLISTGNKMDMTETVLNLRDVRRRTQIIIMTKEGSRSTEQPATVYRIPDIKIFSLPELRSFLQIE